MVICAAQVTAKGEGMARRELRDDQMVNGITSL